MPEEPRTSNFFGDPFQHGDPDFPARNNAVVPHNIVCANENCAVEGGRVTQTICVCLRSDDAGTPHNVGLFCSPCNDAIRTKAAQEQGQTGIIFKEVPIPDATTSVADDDPQIGSSKVTDAQTASLPESPPNLSTNPQRLNVSGGQTATQSTSPASTPSQETASDRDNLQAEGQSGGTVADSPRRPRTPRD